MLIFQTHLYCLFFLSHLSMFYHHDFLAFFFWKSILNLCPCSPQAALPFAVILIKSSSLRSGLGFGSFFSKASCKADDMPAPAIVCLCRAILHCQQVGSLSTRVKGDGLKTWEGEEKRTAFQEKELRRKRNLRNNKQKKGNRSEERRTGR